LPSSRQRNIRKDFCHKTSRKIVDAQWLINVLENLKLGNMTKRAKPKQDAAGKYLPNGAAAKSGLNRVVLDAALGQLLEFVRYKSARAGKILLLVGAQYTSQECASCGHVDSDNRKTQAQFRCTSCGHADNADHNAAVVIARRAVDLILDPGTGLSARGLLSKGSSSDIGRGAEGKTKEVIVASDALGREASRKKQTAALLQEAA
jgi:putative transposase